MSHIGLTLRPVILPRSFGRKINCFALDRKPIKRCNTPFAITPYFTDRERDFLLSRSYYRLTTQYFYSPKQHLEGFSIKGLCGLKHYRVCGLLGYNYSIYGLTAAEMDLSGYGFEKMIARLHLGRCDLLVQ